MTDAEDFLADALEMVTDLGTTCTVIEVAGVYANSAVTETLTTHTGVLCTDLLDESKRYRASDTLLRCSGTFYFPSSGLGFTPAVGNRVTYDSRTFNVLAAFPYRVQGTVVAYRCDVSEAGAA